MMQQALTHSELDVQRRRLENNPDQVAHLSGVLFGLQRVGL
jgi:hypothetical protein